ncbi:MAG: hypothetical protein U1E53_22340 [Dongiaceae bacterium]
MLGQRAAERQVLHPGLRGEPCRVGGEEGEGGILARLVLGQVEADPADQAPARMLRREPPRDVAAGRRDRGACGGHHLLPEPGEQGSVEMLGPGAGRAGRRQALELALRRRRRRRPPVLGQARQGAEAGHEEMAERAAEGQSGRQRRGQLGGAELQQPGSGAALEGGGQPRGQGRRQALARIGRCREQQAAGGRDSEVERRPPLGAPGWNESGRVESGRGQSGQKLVRGRGGRGHAAGLAHAEAPDQGSPAAGCRRSMETFETKIPGGWNIAETGPA